MPFKEKEYHQEENCLNCGYPIIGKFCGNCGQKASFHKDSFWHMAAHFIGDYFHYDSRFWRTIKTLFHKPGLATLEYINGKRVKYLNPIQLYIFVSTLFFLVVLSSGDEHETKHKKEKTESVDSTANSNQQDNENEEIESNNNDSIIAVNSDTSEYKKLDIKDTSSLNESEKEAVRKALNRNKNRFEFDTGDNFTIENKYETLREYDSAQLSLPKEKREGLIKRYIHRKTYLVNEKYETNDKVKEVFTELLIHNFPKAFFLLLPLFALLLKIFYNRKNLYYVDHVIFSLHFHSVIFILLLFVEIVNFITDNETLNDILTTTIFLGFGVYLFVAMKRVYQSRWFVILIKQFFLTFAYMLVFILAIVSIFIITALML